MALTTTRWRYFFVHQDSRQEAWLEAQARRGLHLIRPGLFRFAFLQGESREEKYRLDFRHLRGAARAEYLGLFRDAGWEFLGQIANRYYFRAGSDAFTPEIFTDEESRNDRIRRQMWTVGAITVLLLFETAMGLTQLVQRAAGPGPAASGGAPMIVVVVAGPFLLLAVWCLWQMQRAIRP